MPTVEGRELESNILWFQELGCSLELIILPKRNKGRLDLPMGGKAAQRRFCTAPPFRLNGQGAILHVPAEMFAKYAHPQRIPVVPKTVTEVINHDGQPLRQTGLHNGPPSERFVNGRGDPWPSIRAAADHHRVGAGLRQRQPRRVHVG